MKQLTLRNKTYERIYRAIGIVWLVMLLVVIITGDTAMWNFWLQTIILLLLSVTFISLNFGTLVNRITAHKGILTIRWYTRPGRVSVRINDIEEILGDENYVRIILKTGRTVRLPTQMLEFDEKRAVRKFLKEATGF